MPCPYKERTHESPPRTCGTDRGRRAAGADGSRRADRGPGRHSGGLARRRRDGRADRRRYPGSRTNQGWDQQAADAVEAVAEEAGIEGRRRRERRLRGHHPDPAGSGRGRRGSDHLPRQRLPDRLSGVRRRVGRAGRGHRESRAPSRRDSSPTSRPRPRKSPTSPACSPARRRRPERSGSSSPASRRPGTT